MISFSESKNQINFPEIHESPRNSKKKQQLIKSSQDEKTSKIYNKLLPVTSSFKDTVQDINNKINSIDILQKHYYDEEFELDKKRIQSILQQENTFFQEQENKNGNLAMKYLYYPNVGLSTSQSLMRAMTSFLRANEKIYNAPDRSKNEKKIFLKDLMKKIMYDLTPQKISSPKKLPKG